MKLKIDPKNLSHQTKALDRIGRWMEHFPVEVVDNMLDTLGTWNQMRSTPIWCGCEPTRSLIEEPPCDAGPQ